MAKVQTRRALSISGETYDKLKQFAKTTNRSGSGVVEGLLKALLCSNGVTQEVMIALLDGHHLEARFPLAELFNLPKAEPKKPAPELHDGTKVPEMDDLTKAIRKAGDIFTF